VKISRALGPLWMLGDPMMLVLLQTFVVSCADSHRTKKYFMHAAVKSSMKCRTLMPTASSTSPHSKLVEQ